MINGLDIFYSSKIKGEGLCLVKANAKGLQLVKTDGKCDKTCKKK